MEASKQNSSRVVVVSGGYGFIGSVLLHKLVFEEPDCLFINVDDMRDSGSKDRAENCAFGPTAQDSFQNYLYKNISLENKYEVDQLFFEHQVTDVIHLAAESDVDRSIHQPRETLEANVIGTFNLLEGARNRTGDEWVNPFNRFVYVSTDEVYGQIGINDDPLTEDAPIRPSSPYSASKAAAESFVSAYNRTYGIDTIITRGANTFGPNQTPTKLIPVAMQALKEGHKVPVYGDGRQHREWLPVDSHAEALRFLWKNGLRGGVYNISSGVSLQNLELLKLLAHEAGRDFQESIEFVKDRPGHDYRYAIANERLATLALALWGEKLIPTEQEVYSALRETARAYL